MTFTSQCRRLHIILVLLGLLIIVCAFTDMHKEKMDNYSVYEVTAFNTRERAVLYTLHTKVDDMVFVNGITNEASLPMDVLVDKCCTREFESIMQANDIEYVKLKHEKIISKISDISANLFQHLLGNSVPKVTKEFLCYDSIKQWVKTRIKRNSFLEVIKIGESYEKRDIFVLKISTGRKKKAVFLMGGEEGRDWTSPAMLLNLVDNILEKKLNLKILTLYYDFYILPMFNPDGYMYSMLKDRLWAKNTRVYFPKNPCSENASAIGISIDRNWYFNKFTVKNEECDPVFTGLKPLSEEETIAVSNFLNNIALRLMAFINVRGFENLVTIPYGNDKKYCVNYDVLADIAAAVHDSVWKQHNATFYYGVASKFVYNFSGNVADWVKSQLNTPIVYTFYMKIENYILPSASDIEPLTIRFSTMIKEILLIANTFYGPLFNNVFAHYVNLVILMFNMCLLITGSISNY